MTGTALVLFALTLAVAAGDWAAVGTGYRRGEYVLKPLTMALLIAAALQLDVGGGTAVAAFVVALSFSLVGDVLLMLADERWFVMGLGAFLVGHLAYVVGLWAEGVSVVPLAVGLLLVAVAVASIGLRILRAVEAGDDAELAVPVGAYIVVISIMVASAVGTRNAFAVVGASLFYCSDALIAWNRFVRAHPWGRVAVMVTYHLGQIGLVLSLV